MSKRIFNLSFQLFEPLFSRLGVKVKRVKRLKELEQAQRSMESFFRSGKMPGGP